MSVLVAFLLTAGLLFLPAYETVASSFSAETIVYYSTNGGATEAIVRGLGSTPHNYGASLFGPSVTSVTSQYSKRPSCRMRSPAATGSG